MLRLQVTRIRSALFSARAAAAAVWRRTIVTLSLAADALRSRGRRANPFQSHLSLSQTRAVVEKQRRVHFGVRVRRPFVELHPAFRHCARRCIWQHCIVNCAASSERTSTFLPSARPAFPPSSPPPPPPLTSHRPYNTLPLHPYNPKYHHHHPIPSSTPFLSRRQAGTVFARRKQ